MFLWEIWAPLDFSIYCSRCLNFSFRMSISFQYSDTSSFKSPYSGGSMYCLTNLAISAFEINPSLLTSNSLKNLLNYTTVVERIPWLARNAFKNLKVSSTLSWPLLSVSNSFQIFLTVFLTLSSVLSLRMLLTNLKISALDSTPSPLTSNSANILLNTYLEAVPFPLFYETSLMSL